MRLRYIHAAERITLNSKSVVDSQLPLKKDIVGNAGFQPAANEILHADFSYEHSAVSAEK
jgi:hypothetical protein